MKIFYTGSSAFLGDSTAKTSLGGYISSTEVPNDFLQNVFDMVSLYGQQQKKPSYAVLALYNESTTQTAGDIGAYWDYPDESSDSTELDEIEASFAIAGAAVVVDDCGNLGYQKVKQGAAPYGVTFVEADIDNPLVIPDMAPETYYIVILKRTLHPATMTDVELERISKGLVQPDTREDVVLKIDYELS